jgi:predicted nucleic-acid-binding protein
MLGIDTNVLVRFLVRDNEAQFEKAQRLIRRDTANDDDIFISLVVLAETEWVLRTRYRLNKENILGAVSGLLDAAEVEFEDEAAVEEAVAVWEDTAADFADCLIGAHNRRSGCRSTATFDVNAAKLPNFVPM